MGTKVVTFDDDNDEQPAKPAWFTTTTGEYEVDLGPTNQAVLAEAEAQRETSMREARKLVEEMLATAEAKADEAFKAQLGRILEVARRRNSKVKRAAKAAATKAAPSPSSPASAAQPKRSVGTTDRELARAWLKANGYKVGERGVIKTAWMDEYRKAVAEAAQTVPLPPGEGVGTPAKRVAKATSAKAVKGTPLKGTAAQKADLLESTVLPAVRKVDKAAAGRLTAGMLTEELTDAASSGDKAAIKAALALTFSEG